jgi:quaternary ammonium compound-resistance protein SugE
LAGVLEVGWAIGLKYTDGFSKLWPSVVTVALMVGSFSLLSEAMRSIPIGTVYAVWTGIGAVGNAVLGSLFFGDSTSLARIIGIALIAGGIFTLRLG